MLLAVIADPLLAKPVANCLESLRCQKAAIESHQWKSKSAVDSRVEVLLLKMTYRYQVAQPAKGAGCLAALTLADEGAGSDQADRTGMPNQCCKPNATT